MQQLRRSVNNWTLQPCTSNSWLGVDRISSLPDELLIRILELVPTKDAVATSILSRRWRRVYTWMTWVEFDYSPVVVAGAHCLCCEHLMGKFPRFTRFVDNVLQASQSTRVTKFMLRLGKGLCRLSSDYNSHCVTGRVHSCRFSCLPAVGPTHVNEWICFPSTCGVRELDLHVHVKVPGKLPPELYCCKTIEILKLDMNLMLEVPMSFSSLPYLKVLHLSSLKISANDDSFSRLVAGCSALEDLSVIRCHCLSKDITLSAPSLKRLVIDMVFEESFKRNSVVSDAPVLQYFEYGDNLSLKYSFKKSNALEKAFINTEQPCGDPEVSFQSMVTLFRPLTNIQQLSLGGFCIEVLEDGESKDKLPVFDNLKHLVLYFNHWTRWHRVLLDLLNCSPRLERLSFPEFSEGISGTGCNEHKDEYDGLTAELEYQYWSTTQTIPSCVRFHLKQIVIDGFWGIQRELEMVKYFLKNASVLEELVISYKERADEISIKSAVRNLPKGSMNCSIKWSQVVCEPQ